jgi:PAS domain S-box-containing protein
MNYSRSEPHSIPPQDIWRRSIWIIIVAASYIVGAWLGLTAATVADSKAITLVWPPTGIAIAAFMRGGYGIWPGVAIGSFLTNWWFVSLPVPVALIISVGNTLGPWLTVWALRRLQFHCAFDRRRDAWWFCLSVAIGLFIPPTVGISALTFGGADWSWEMWIWWWLGDVVGALVIAPFLFTSQRQALRQFVDHWQVLEFLALILVTFGLGSLLFLNSQHLAVTFLTMPLIFWSALRFGAWGSSLNVVIFAALAATGTAQHRGTFADPGFQSQLLLTAYLATVAVLNLLLIALLAERNRAEVTLRAGSERLRLALDHAHMVTCEVDLRALSLTWGAGAEILFGGRDVPQTMAAFFACVHPDDQAHLQAAMARGLSGTQPRSYAVEYRVLLSDGTARWLASVGEFLTDSNDNVIRTSGLSYDITDRRQAEQALRESELRNRTLVDHSPEAIVVFDVERGVLCDANPRACQMFGLALDQLLNQNPITLSPPNQPDGQASISAAQTYVSRAVAGEVPRFEWVHRDARGVDFPCEIWLVRLPSTGRMLIRGTMVDISERKLAQAALSTSEERLRVAFAAAGLGAWEADLTSGKISWSEECRRLHHVGTSPAPRTAAEFFALVHVDDRAALQAAFDSTITQRVPLQGEYRTIDAQGHQWWLATYARCLCDAQGHPLRVIGVVMDVSTRHHADAERKRLEKHLFHAQKLEAIGTLAGGIAHDFNNILAAIIGNLELAHLDISAQRPIKRRLENILTASHRARDLVRQILAFSRQQDGIHTVQRLDPLLHEVAALLRASLPTSITIEVEIDPACPMVEVDTTQIHQVLMNLCTNAWQALPAQRGRLIISMAPVYLSATEAEQLPGLVSGSFLRLSVSDTGSGIDTGTLSRIFDPFFTTKPTGEGTGLGLAVVHGIIQAHHGAIMVNSQLGRGTTFHAYLPAAPLALQPSTSENVPALPHGQDQHVFFIDDEPALMELGTILLEELGYRVSGYGSANAALSALRDHPAGVHLVISDLTMPDLSGLELARQMLRICPDLPIIITTGYSGALTEEQVQAAGIRAMLLKPVSLESLAAAVHQHVKRPTELKS